MKRGFGHRCGSTEAVREFTKPEICIPIHHPYHNKSAAGGIGRTQLDGNKEVEIIHNKHK